MKKIELLSPAGDIKGCIAAIKAGCDAVYLGGKFFGARNYAENFSKEELEETIFLCHTYNVKVYITVNTIVYEEEVKAFMEYIDFLVSIHADALIMQDLGMIDLVRQTYPEMEIHASTQMNIHSLDGALFAKSLGLKRVVLARETSIEEIKRIKENTDIEVEVFGHGALCVSYSGQCLMSYFVGGRSGNRGTCAGTCRQKYTLEDQEGKKITNGYLLSMKDLNVLEHLDTFIKSGIDSLKIEGRMKRPEYIYIVTKIYRKTIDHYYKTGKIQISKKDMQDLYLLFNRKFTKGYVLLEENKKVVHTFRPNHMGIDIGEIYKVKPNYFSIKLTSDVSQNDGIRILNEEEDQGFLLTNIYKNGKKVKEAKCGETIEIRQKAKVKEKDKVIKTTDFKRLSEIKKEMEKPFHKIALKGSIIIYKNKPVRLCLTDGIYKVQKESIEFPEEAINVKICKEEVKRKIGKLGNTPYFLEELHIDIEENTFLPIHILNELRRECIKILHEKRGNRETFTKKEYQRSVKPFPYQRQKGVLFEGKLDPNKIKDFDYIYVTNSHDLMYPNTFLKLPRIVEKYKPFNQLVLISEIGALPFYKQKNTDFAIPVVNSYTLAYLHSIGCNRVTLSYELKENRIKKIIQNYHKRYHAHPNVEVIVCGPKEAMVTKYNLLDSYHIKEGYLKDSYHNKYLVKNNLTYTTIYHYEKQNLQNLSLYYEIGVNALRFIYIEEKNKDA